MVKEEDGGETVLQNYIFILGARGQPCQSKVTVSSRGRAHAAFRRSSCEKDTGSAKETVELHLRRHAADPKRVPIRC